MESWLVGSASPGPREATLALPLPCRRLSKGLARPFLPISVSTVSLLLVSTPGGLLLQPLPAGLRGRSRFLSAPCLSPLPFPSPSGGPHPSAPTDPQGGRRALAACGDGEDLSPAVPCQGCSPGWKGEGSQVTSAGGGPWPGAPRMCRISGEGRSRRGHSRSRDQV